MKPVPDKQITAHLNTKQQKNHPTGARTRSRLLSERSMLVGLGCLASLGLLSKGLVWAQTETPPAEQALPGAAELQPLFEAPLAPPEPEAQVQREPDPEPQAEVRAPSPDYITEQPPAQYYLPEPALIPLPEATAQEPPFEAPVNPEARAATDQTDYSVGATSEYEAPTRIEFAERSTGCEGSVSGGQGVGGLCGPAAVPEPVTAEAAPPSYSPERSIAEQPSYNPQTPSAGGPYIATPPPRNLPQSPGTLPNLPGNVRGTVAGNNSGNPISKVGQAAQQIGNQLWGQGNQSESAYTPSGYSADSGYPANPGYSADGGYSINTAAYAAGPPEPSMGLGPVQVGAISVSSGSNTGFAYYNLTPRPLGRPGNGNTSLLFPLSIAAEITSPFGWRTHPVMGYGKFHTGTDLGAPMGTPVLAAYAGQVAIADWLGGYGLTVVLSHSKQSQETLYGHLSELFVKPGEFVKQGDTIGRVGSTGMSTGPHLHFEIRQMTAQGWVAIDPGAQLEFAVAKMIGTLETAKIPQMPKFVETQSASALKDLENDLPQLPPLPVGMDIEVHNLQPPFPELLKADTSAPKDKETSKPKIQKQASR
ncbi:MULTISPECIES: peptidoglycan DD-metalloendopeptidase family protein [unclassified Microcoleus]|uniref:M23 family metallopeptidase n=1 Tax=unclassified Microcoleus TaxID=2642155 RepID=UPI0025FF407F|nr:MULTISPECIES: peptidoglycan DD-metalloendopeptidase family protein [unclassified Microcoleus]